MLARRLNPSTGPLTSRTPSSLDNHSAIRLILPSLPIMTSTAKVSLIRVLIPSLRLFSFYGGIYAVGMWEYAVYAPPLQKVFYARMFDCLWGVLALTPFILLRWTLVFRIYCLAFAIWAAFSIYNSCFPFRYVSPTYDGTVPETGVSEASSGNDDNIGYWVSFPTAPNAEGILIAVVHIAPVILACVYRRYYRSWAVRQTS